MNLHFESALLHRNKIDPLFVAAFPKEERPPIRLLYKRHKQGKADFRAVMDGETFVGLVLITGCEAVKTLMFFAMEENLRGQGYGSRILDMLKEEFRDVPFSCAPSPWMKRRITQRSAFAACNSTPATASRKSACM